MGDEAALGFQRLPHVGVEAAFGNVAEDLHEFVGVALAEDASVALLDVGGTPRGIEMVQRHEAALDVRAFAHFWSAAEEDAHFAFTHGFEERSFGGVFVVVLDEGDVCRGHASGD